MDRKRYFYGMGKRTRIKTNIVLGCFVRATKGLKTGGYADGAHHPAMLERARSGGECWKNPPRQENVSMQEARVEDKDRIG